MISKYINVCTVDLAESLKNIGDLCYWVTHPLETLWNLWGYTVELSFLVCLTVCLISIILYIFNLKKYAKYAPISLTVYTIIQCISSGLR